MADGEKSESDLVGEAKVSILKRIATLNDSSLGLKGTLELAMAYTVLDRGKLPGSDVGNG